MLSTDVFNSEGEIDSVVCMLLNQTEVKASDCVRIWISNLQKEGEKRDHETYGAIALLLVGKIYSHSGEAVSSGISSLY